MQEELTVIEHLEELRKRIIIGIATLIISTVIAFPFSERILEILKRPGLGLIEKLVYFSPPDAFLTYVRIAGFCGFLFAMPVILYQVWLFLSPALGKSLRIYSLSFISFSLAAFISGCLFAYYIALPFALGFLLNFAKGSLQPLIGVDKYISFVIWIILGCGLTFQMPVLSFVLAKINMINAKFLIRKFKYAVLAIFIIAAAITPTPDVFNMCVLAVPMLLLYAISIGVVKLAQPKWK